MPGGGAEKDDVIARKLAAAAQMKKEKSREKRKKKKKFWLSAWNDPMANLACYGSCIRFADLDGDGNYSLLCATQDKKLKVFRDMSTFFDSVLLGTPVALVSLYTDSDNLDKPSIAIAAGPYVFIYRHLRPYFKFTVPPNELNVTEVAVWESIKTGSCDIGSAVTQLTELRDSGADVTARTVELLSYDDEAERTMFADRVKNQPLVQTTVITCMEKISTNSSEEISVSRLVIGTENKRLLIVDATDCSIVVSCQLPGVPVFIAALGLMDNDYRILVASRSGRIFIIKNGELSTRFMRVDAPPVGIVCISSRDICIGQSGKVIHSFHIKGKKNWSMNVGHNIKDMTLFAKGKSDKARALLVALENGEIRLYRDRQVVCSISTPDVVLGMRCGRYGREDVSLVIVHRSGALSVKIFRRAASIDVVENSAPPEQDVPIKVPKKTQLFIENSTVEIQQGVEMHKIFQRELCLLRLNCARSYVKVITDGNGPISYSSKASVRLNADVHGLGPLFKLTLKIQNTGRQVLQNSLVTFGFDHNLYAFKRPLFALPFLTPGVSYEYEVAVQSVHPSGAAGVVRVFVADGSGGSASPLISAVINMPMSEILE